MGEADSFFSRWSRRKAAVVQGQPIAEPPANLPPPRGGEARQTDLSAEGQPAAQVDPAEAVSTEPALPALTLEDAQALKSDSDFKPFTARAVAPEVRNAAMKKLFSDPHFNVMDRLDIYIDDYSQPDPLPASMLREMVSAKFLNLFDDEDKAEAVNLSLMDVAPAQAAADMQQSTNFLPTESAPLMAHATANPADDAHADLRLQPYDAAFGAPLGESAEPVPPTAQRAVPP